MHGVSLTGDNGLLIKDGGEGRTSSREGVQVSHGGVSDPLQASWVLTGELR
jgi:hypothetical protein